MLLSAMAFFFSKKLSLVLLLLTTNTDGFFYSSTWCHRRRTTRGVKKDEPLISDADLEPKEWQENRDAARQRRLVSGFDAKGERRRALLAAQQKFRERERRKPKYKPLTKKLSELEVGDFFEDCTVRKLRSYGAYVSIGSEIDGFLHVKDLRNDKFVADAADELRLGQGVDVYVKAVDAEKQILQLACFQNLEKERRPLEAFSINDRLENALVLKVTDYAAYVDVNCSDTEGYLHVMDIGLFPRQRIGRHREPRVKPEPGLVISEAWVTAIDFDRRRMRISTIPPDERPETLLPQDEETRSDTDQDLNLIMNDDDDLSSS